MSRWPGILKILEIKHVDVDGTVLWERCNIRNMMHHDGHWYVLAAAFTGGQESSIVPAVFHVGLDNRTTVTIDDSPADLAGEPSGSGYERIELTSDGDFSLNFESEVWTATSPVLSFQSTTGTWGPVTQLFLVAEVASTEKLIATATIPTTSVSPGQSVTMRLNLALLDESEV